MADLTPHGRRTFQNAVLGVPKRVHLYVDGGELQGYGYESRPIEKAKFSDNGSYPEIMWVFNAGNEEAMVLGMYVTDANGKVLFSDPFPEPYRVQNQGDRIGVALDMAFLGAMSGESDVV